ncbi:MAG: riboflavin synthase [Kiritimatiellae bacterium]|nr:riboflavin synthase [Kiritimatiellia bacterium]
MFTGLIQKTGRFKSVTQQNGGSCIRIDCEAWANDPYQLGESIAVDGVCLTLVAHDATGFSVDVLKETLDVTTLAKLKHGASVNLERAMRADARFGGHIVQGHVDGVGTISAITPAGRDISIRIKASEQILKQIVYKGSIAINGISLTVAKVISNIEFEVCIIPTTLRDTSLGEKRVGDKVNLETDVLARYGTQQAKEEASTQSNITIEMLQNAGFKI